MSRPYVPRGWRPVLPQRRRRTWLRLPQPASGGHPVALTPTSISGPRFPRSCSFSFDLTRIGIASELDPAFDLVGIVKKFAHGRCISAEPDTITTHDVRTGDPAPATLLLNVCTVGAGA